MESEPAYEHVPSLQEMIHHNGRPGVEYAIVSQENAYRAQQAGWEEITGGARIFPIRGPKGTVYCKLLGKGKPIKGQQMGSLSKLYIDKTVSEKTGLILNKQTTRELKTEQPEKKN